MSTSGGNGSYGGSNGGGKIASSVQRAWLSQRTAAREHAAFARASKLVGERRAELDATLDFTLDVLAQVRL
jgi:hypothetical protein